MILDLGLPDMDGTEVLRSLRGSGSALPIIVLTARGEVSDRVEGLDLGADDYLTKPFAFDELLARIRARRRDHDGGATTTMTAGDVELDIPTRRVRVGENRFDLAAREFALLQVLLRRPGQVLTREQLLSQVWELDSDPGSNVVAGVAAAAADPARLAAATALGAIRVRVRVGRVAPGRRNHCGELGSHRVLPMW